MTVSRNTFMRLALGIAICTLLSGAAAAQILPNRYVLTLQDEPVSSRFASRAQIQSDQAAAYRAQIEDRQASVKRELASRNFSVTGSVSLIHNLIFVTAPSNRAAELASIPGVVSVRPMRRFKAALNRATQLMNAPAAWTQVGGQQNAGAGIKIAILDTGIDQTHAAFQDSTLQVPAGFPKCTNGHPEDCAYTNKKVIVARSYVRIVSSGSDAANPAADDLPDDYSPRDRNGHGTAVASVAAATSISTPAVSSTGQAITIQGMAPKAWLGNYKIAGSPGVAESANDQSMIQAVEDAVADGMDVISTSFGSPATSDYASDPVSVAFENAVKAGAVVIVAAGNGGAGGSNYPSFNSIITPSNAPDVISVGATENSHVLLPAVTVNASSAPSTLKGIPAQPSDSLNYPSSFGVASAPLIDVTTLGDNGLACNPLPAFSLNGAFALIERGTCAFATKATNAQDAGAIGIIFYMADGTAPLFPEGLDPNDAAFVGPAVMISNASGVALKNWTDAHPGQAVTIDSGGTEVDLATWSQNVGLSPAVAANMLAAFSSTGPTPDGMLKPDIVATGGNDLDLSSDPNDFYVPAPSGIYMATQSYDPNQQYFGGSAFSQNGFLAANGTSFGAPMVAGAAALVKQAHAGTKLRGTQLKSLLVNSASQNIVQTEDYFGYLVDTQWIGAGLLNAGAAAAASITAEPSTVSFGILNSITLPVSKAITITNIGSSAATLSVAVSCCSKNGIAGAVAGLQVTADQASLSLAPGASTTLNVSLKGTLPAASEYSGTVTLQQGSNTTSIPFLFLVGDGIPANVNILSDGGEGAPGQDVGPAIIQVLDQYGVPVANSPVTFTIKSSGRATVASVSGQPACAPASSTSRAICNTNQFGIAYAEVTLGTTPGTVQVAFDASGINLSPDCSFQFQCYNIQNPPAITGIADAAAGVKQLVPGSYVAIYGSGLSDFSDNNGTVLSLNTTPTAAATDPVISNGVVLPLQIDYVTVSFDVPSAGISVAGHPTFVSPGQVNVQVPWELQGQSSAKVKVTLNGDLIGNVVDVPIAANSPAFFMNSGTVVDALDPNYKLITTANPAVRGQVIALYANGIGSVSNAPASGDPAGASPLATTPIPVVTIGGQSATVKFSGLSPGYPGLYQINVVVPTNISAGVQNVTIALGGATSPVATLPVQ